METQFIVLIATILTFVILGFAMSRSIKNYEKNAMKTKKKKGRTKYMQESSKPGKR